MGGNREPLLGGELESGRSSPPSSPKSRIPNMIKQMPFRLKYMALIGGLVLVVIFSFIFFNVKEQTYTKIEYIAPVARDHAFNRQEIIIYFWDTPSSEQDKTGMLVHPNIKGPQSVIVDDENNKNNNNIKNNINNIQNNNNNNLNFKRFDGSTTTTATSNRKLQQLPDRNIRKRIPLQNRVASAEDEECEVSCLYSHHVDDLPYADYIVFDPSHLHPDNWRRMPVSLPEKHVYQKFVLLNYNSVSQFPIANDKRYLDLMDIHINYTSNSDQPVSMACPPNAEMKFNEIQELLLEPSNVKQRSKDILFMSSNCKNGFSKARTIYVADLMRHIKVESVGDCLTNRARILKPDNDDIFSRIKSNIKTFTDYKIVLTFENENTTDYITEKVYSALFAGAIPVYMGASNIDDWVPTNSVIKASKFLSPKELAAYLQEVLNNPNMMDYYLEWKKKPLEPKVIEKFSRCIGTFKTKCDICKMAYNKLSDDEYKYKELIFGGGAHYQPYHVQFEGKGDYIEVMPSKKCERCFDLTDHYTLMTWVKPNSFGDQRLIDKGTPNKIDGYDFDIQKTSTGRGTPRLCAAGVCFSSHITISTDVWSHIAVVFSVNNPNPHDNQVNFYINGVQDLPNEYFNPTLTNNLTLAIGKSYAAGPLDSGTYHGLMDNVAIYNRSLTHEEVQKAMWSKPDQTDSSLVLYLDFDNSIETRSNERKLAFDKSIYGNHGMCTKGEKGDISQKILSYGKDYAFNRCL